MNSDLERILLGKDLLLADGGLHGEPALTKERASELIATIEDSFESLGYSLSPSSADMLAREFGEKELSSFYRKAFNELKGEKGANASHAVFYKNFPAGVLTMGEAELKMRAYMHYFSVALKDAGISDYDYMADDIPQEKRLPFDESHKPTVLTVIGEDKAKEIIYEYAKSILGSSVAMTDKQIGEIKTILKEYRAEGAASAIRPDVFRFKETMAFWVLEMENEFGVPTMFSDVSDLVNWNRMTATDLLRVYGIVSDGNATITTQNIKYVSLPRAVRRFILGKLDAICEKFYSAGNGDLIEDEFGTHNFRWNCAFRQLHAGDYASEFQYLSMIVEACRSHTGCVTIASSIGSYIRDAESNGLKSQDALDKIIRLLSKKPGVFARHLDSLLRNPAFAGKEKDICEGFAKVSDDISIGVLIQLRDHFTLRGTEESVRFFTYEANGMMITHAEDDDRDPINPSALSEILKTIDDSIKRFEAAHATPEGYNLSGKVYVSDSMANYRVPSSSRTASGATKSIPRGSRIKLDGVSDSNGFIRVFTHWRNLGKAKPSESSAFPFYANDVGRVDIDLSAQFYDKDMKLVETVSWNCRIHGNFAVHSGDVTDAPNGASEFIDIDIKKAKKLGIRYVAVVNSSFLGIPWKDIPECFSGVMVRNGFGKNEGEIYDPRAVQLKFDLTQNSSAMNVAFAYDLETDQLIWIDSPFIRCNVASIVSDGVGNVILGALKPHMTMRDLIMLSSGRFGSIAKDPKDADVVFGDSETSEAKDAKVIRPTDQEEFEKLFM